MCTNPTRTAANLMTAIEPTIKLLLPLTGATQEQQDLVISEYETALNAVKNWNKGTAADEVLQLLNAFDAGFNALPVPDQYKALANIILAGVAAVIGVITANTVPSGGPADASASPEEFTAHHQAVVVADTTAKVNALVPTFQQSIWHSPESQYKAAWNKQVEADALPDSMKV